MQTKSDMIIFAIIFVGKRHLFEQYADFSASISRTQFMMNDFLKLLFIEHFNILE